MTNTPPDDRRALLQSALQAIDNLQAQLDDARRDRDSAGTEPIAIIGMSCRFPGGAISPETYWELLRSGRDAVTEYPQERRTMAEMAGVDLSMLDEGTTWYGGFLDDIDQFDPQFFGISPREAATMDPQQRLVLEVSWEALERAGIAPDSLNGSATGVFIGITANEYVQLAKLGGPENLDVYTATGGALNAAPGRIAYTLGLQGPCMAIDTACSSSLVALHQACQSLRTGESELALAGGVNVLLLPEAFICFNRWGMMAPDGRCKTFDVAADGFVRGEGCGVVVLKRLRDAIAAGDPVLAVIRGSAVNQDGRSSGLTVPNGLAQQAVLRQALTNAGVNPAEVQYFEAHGTGTTLGDPIEIEAMGAVLGRGRPADREVVVGSVKTNIGHLESASGIAGLIKVVLAMQHGEIPPNLHFHQPSPQIPWPPFPVTVPTKVLPWPGSRGRRLAGVSGFGFSGTNAHVVLESPPLAEMSVNNPPDDRPQVLVLSARTGTALRETALRCARWIDEHDDLAVADVCATMNVGRAALPQRLAVVASTRAELSERLSQFALGDPTERVDGLVTGRAGRPRVAFLFTGQGAQYAGMARRLYDAEPVFRAALDRCAAVLDPLLPEPLLTVVFAEPDTPRAALLDQTAFTQPALFAVEYALAELWRSWGVASDAMLGHSVGEIAAAAVADVFSLEDAARLIVARGALMQALPDGGAMTAIFAPLADIDPEVARHADVAVAAVNGPAHTVISGGEEAVAAVATVFAERGVRVQALTVSHAFHSPLMHPMLDEFRKVAESITYRAPQRRVVSNVTGGDARAELASADYWVKHVMAPVRFADGMNVLRASGIDTFVEIGPHPVLTTMGQSCVTDGEVTWASSMRRSRDDGEQILLALGALFVSGVKIDWPSVRSGGRRRTMPTTPFERQRHWIDPARPIGRAGRTGHPLVGTTTRAPLLGATLHDTVIAAGSPAWLDDHRLAGTIVFPGTAYTELVLAAIDVSVDEIESMSISQPLVVPEQGSVALQTVVTERVGSREVQIISIVADQDAPTYTVHAHATVRPRRTIDARSAGEESVDISALTGSCPEEVDVEQYYEHLRSVGLTYGPTFQGLTRLMRRDGAAVGHVELPPEITDGDRYRLHPALFDACFHVLGAAIAPLDTAADDMFVPVAIDGVRLYRPGAGAAWCAATLLGDSGRPSPARRASYTAALALYDAVGTIIATVDRLEVRRTPRRFWQHALGVAEDPVYEVRWRAEPGPTELAPDRDWLIVGDRHGVADELAVELGNAGASYTLVHPSADVGDLRTRIGDLLERASLPIGVVYLPALDVMSPGDDGVDQAEHSLGGALSVVQVLAEHVGVDARLWLVTRNSQSVDGEPASPVGATLWGLGRVVANEQPLLACTCVDLDPDAGTAVTELAGELLHVSGEDQVVLRGPHRFVARLARIDTSIHVPPTAPYHLVLPERGSFEALAFEPLDRRSPGAGEIEIEVRATGLNFRDVLNVLGMYPGDPGLPGLESAGVVSAVGTGVADLAVGDAVVGIAPTAYDSSVITRADLVVRKPDRLSFAEAATVPIAYLTAAYGLQHLAALQPGERVLIHAAAGGVGMAAVNIAKRIGAEIYATVGSTEKRRALERLGVRNIYSSRTLDFAEQIRVDTGGAGIDVVLNSLADDFIGHSFSVLAPTGRFLEIGKRGIWTVERAAAARPDGSYHVYDLADFLGDDGGLHSNLQEIVDDIAAGRAEPLPLRAFGVEDIEQAFRYVAQARHIGKVVLTHRPAGPRYRSDAAYVITGGLGGIGLALAAWLVDNGARHLTLTGRSQPSPDAEAIVAGLEALGATVNVVLADIADPSGIERVLSTATRDGHPLRGVFHAAGITDDGALGQQTWARFDRVLAPKLVGAVLLDRATHAVDLDHFVLFSSASALLGAAGQSNYAAANSALDAIAHRRRAAGSPALSVNWGAWADVGMAARLDARQRQSNADRGVRPMSSDDALDVMDRLLGQCLPQVAVLLVDWSRMVGRLDAVPPMLTELVAVPSTDRRGSPTRGGGSLVHDLSAVAPTQRWEAVRAFVSEQIARVLGLAARDAVDPDQDLAELGMDSLMAVELTNRLRSSTGLALPATLALEHTTARALADHLLPLVTSSGETHSPDRTDAADVDPTALAVVSVDRSRPIPASSAQQRLLFVDQLAPGLAIYNIPLVIRLRGRLDVEAIRAAIAGVVRRHEALRTKFVSGESGMVQDITPPDDTAVPFTVRDAVPADALDELLGEELSKPFDLRAGLKLRAALYRLADDESVLALTVHHIATDGWSIGRLMAEISEIYSAAVSGRELLLPQLAVQYADWSVWQRAVEQSSIHADGLAYWTETLSGPLPILDLPADHSRPALQSYRGGTTHVDLDPGWWAGVRSAARTAGVTPFVFMLSGYIATLARWTGQDDLIVGTASANRSRPEVHDTVGLFVNMLGIRVAVDIEQPFIDLVETVRTSARGAFAHEGVPFDRIVEAINPPRNLDRPIVFQTAFVLNNMALPKIEIAGLDVEVIEASTGATEYDLACWITERGDAAGMLVDYNADVFDGSTISHLLEQWQCLMSSAMADPTGAVGDLSMTSGAHRQTLLSQYASPIAAPGAVRGVSRLDELVQLRVLATPDRTAFVHRNATMSFREWDARSNALAHRLIESGVVKGSRVGVAVDRSMSMVVAVLAVFKAGAAYVPLDPALPTERLTFMLIDSGVTAVLASADAFAADVDLSDVVVLDVSALAAEIEHDVPPVRVDTSDLPGGGAAWVIYTSGSTGTPKGVEVEHASAINFVLAMLHEPGIDTDDVVLAVPALSFDPSVLDMFVPMLVGAKVVIADRDDIVDVRRLQRLLASSEATLMQATPTMWSLLIESGWPGSPTLKALCGGETMPVDLAARLLNRCGSVWNLYGPTETTVWSTVHRVAEASLERLHVPIGRPIANMVYRVLDARGELSPVGVPGEIVIGGIGVARGYVNRADLTAERFSDDTFEPGHRLYRTGDLGRWLPDGNLEFLGRSDFQVKLRGNRVELGEIETALRRLDGVSDAVVVARGEGAAMRLAAYLVSPSAHDQPTVTDLRSALLRTLPDYMVPAAFVWMDAFPLTSSRKIDRLALPQPDVSATLATEYVAPRDDVEQEIARIVAARLELDSVGVNHDFFELGGHSLDATDVVAKIESTFDVAIDLRSFFLEPTVANLSTIVRRGAAPSGRPVIRVDRGERLMASSAQQRMLFVDQLAGGLGVYNVPAVVRLAGHLDRAALRSALADLIRRHESLRTNFVFSGGAWTQEIADADTAVLPWMVESVEGPFEDALARAHQEVARPFDVVNDVKLRALLLQLGDDDHVLVLTMHHIAVDGWSVRRLLADLVELYTARLDDRAPVLPELPVQYADYAAWERSMIESGERDAAVTYWVEQLGGPLPLLDLPTDRPRPAVQTHRSGSFHAELSGELITAIRLAARDAGVTPFVVLLSGYVATLGRWSGQHDFVVGTASANRSRPEVESVVGMFVNTLALRIGLDPEQSFGSLLGDVRRTVFGAFEHEDVPFDRIVNEINPDRDLSRSAVYQTMFVLNNTPMPTALAMPGIVAEPIPATTGVTDTDLTVSIVEHPGGVAVHVEFNADVFDPPTIARLVDHWQRLLTSASHAPSTAVGALSMLSSTERRLLVHEMANGPVIELNGPLRLDLLVAERAGLTPAATAVVCGEESITYRELMDRAHRLGRALVAAGVRPTDRVGIAVDRSVAMVVSVLAVLETGAAYVPLDPTFPADRLAFMVSDAALAVVLVSDGSLHGRLETTGLHLIDVVVDAAEIETFEASPLGVDTSAQPGGGVAYVIYTSGSTGRPKGVEIEHVNAVNLVQSMLREPGFVAGDVFLAITTLSFDISVLELFGPLAAGGCVVIADKDDVLDGRRLGALIESSAATMMQATPTTWSMLFESGWQGRPGLTVLSGGEPMSDSLGWRMVQRCGPVWNLYGPTETTVWSTVQRVDESVLQRAIVQIGRPIANTVLRVLDARGELAPVGVPGELFIGGTGVARGYLGRPELTAERFVVDPFGQPTDRLYRSGDLARWLPDGTVEFLGRLDFQVKVRGNRIELGEIESALRDLADIADAVVVASDDRLVAYLIPAIAGVEPSVAALRAALQRRLPEYMVPSLFGVIDEFPMTPNNKIDRAALPAADIAAPASAPFVAPRTTTERVVAGIVETVLDVERVGVNDDFFELGGHSLDATAVLAAIDAALGTTVELRTFFLAPTVAAVALHLSTGTGSMLPPVEVALRDRPVATSSAQDRLLFFDRLAPGMPVYNVPLALRLRGSLALDALGAAVTQVVRLHEALRTNFAVVDTGGWTQVVVDPADVLVTVPYEDLRDRSPGDAIAALQAEASRPFDLYRDVKFRAAVYQVADHEWFLALTMHHIATDGWSTSLVVQQLLELYAAEVDGREAGVVPPRFQYIDYTAWRREVERSPSQLDDLGYWVDVLGGTLPVLDLPLDRSRPPVQTFRAGSIRFALDDETVARLRAASRAAGVTPFVFLLTSYLATLARWSGQDDFVVGTATANRPLPELHDVVGLFVDMVAIRSGVDLGRPFSHLLSDVRDAALGAFGHENVPFERIVEAIAPPRDLSRSIVFQTVFMFNNLPAPDVSSVPGASVEVIGVERSSIEYDVAVWMSEAGPHVGGVVEFNAEVFDQRTIERLVSQWQILLDAALSDPDCAVGDLDMLPPDERRLLLEDFASSSCEPFDLPAGVHRLDQLVAHRCAAWPDAVAFEFADSFITYRQLMDRSNQLARHLVAAGVSPGDRVGIAVERSLEMAISVFAVHKTGAAYVPLDPAYPAERLQFMIADSGIRVLLVSSRIDLEHEQMQAIDVVGDWSDIAERDPSPLDVDTSEMAGGGAAWVIYTSGSTGLPKGVEVEHASAMNFVLAMLDEPGCTADDVLLAVPTLSFDPSVLDLFVPALVGARAVIATRADVTDAGRLATLIESSRATMMQATPTTWSMLLESGWGGSSRLTALCGGEALQVDLARRLLAACASLWNLYGPTETTVWSAVHEVTGSSLERVDVPVGKPIRNMVYRVLDDRGQLAPIGVAGELVIGGCGVARGYVNQPERTSERFVIDPLDPTSRVYRTGDLVRWRPDGNLEFLGRLDFQVKLRGNRIELGEIEAVLRELPMVADAVVVADGVGSTMRLVAYLIAADPDSVSTVAELRAPLRRRLPEFMIPSTVTWLDVFPLTPSRKVDRTALQTAERPGSPSDAEGWPDSAGDSLERMLVDIWRKVLGHKQVGIHDDFFALGGYSLLATRLFALVEERTGLRLPVLVLFEHPTISALAAVIRDGGWKTEWESLVPIQPAGARQPFFYVSPYLISVLELAPLGDELGRDRPLYGLQPRGLDGSAPPHTTIEEMAAHYIAEMKAVQPDGPYALGGHCSGSWVAFEMARQLEAAGDETSALVLVDQGPPGVDRPTSRPLQYVVNRVRLYSSGRRLRDAFAWQIKIMIARVLLRRVGSPTARFTEAVKEAHRVAYRSYRGGRVTQEITLVLSADSLSLTDKQWYTRWSELTDGHFMTRNVGGTHANLLMPPHVQDLAREIASTLDAADAESEP